MNPFFCPVVVVLVVAMRKKLNRAPMQALLAHLKAHPALQIIEYDHSAMLSTPIERWPRANVLIPLVSTGFPIDLADQYASLRAPVVVNDLAAHTTIRDRILTRLLLKQHNVPIAKGLVYDADAGDCRLLIGDQLRVYTADGTLRGVLKKPFVEKPADADDHDVFIYYRGGGARRLHRKIGNVSSEYLPERTEIRGAANSFVYERFHSPAMCADVKVYAAGDYFYAEARKAPHIDGRVERDDKGLEVRTRVQLTREELGISKRVVDAFGQFMNGFDLLRTKEGRTFVIDVNGWSFVKRANEFAPNCASKLIAFILHAASSSTQSTVRTSNAVPQRMCRPTMNDGPPAEPPTPAA